MFPRKKVRFSIVAAALLVVFLVGSCRKQNVVTPVAAVPTATPAIDRTQLAPDSSQNPYRQYAPGLLARTVYKAEGADRFEVEIWDLLVGPGKKTEPATLPGGAVFEVRSGEGVLQVSGKRNEVKTGATLAVGDGESFQIDNGSTESAVSIRAVVIRARGN
jgi:mannose-6-phosphate isomerase-like protein (cupin superfamily)